MPENEKWHLAMQRQKLEALGQFAGGIAHDFNNILSIIEGYTFIALRQLREGVLTEDQLQKTLAVTQRGAGLTRQLLAFARQKVDVEHAVDLVAVLHEQSVLLRPLLGDTVTMSLRMPEGPVWLNASSDQITQMVLNLALNARDAMPDGGALLIEVSVTAENKAHIRVADTGTGIDESIIKNIFDPFFTTKDVSKGTGLGLSIVYGIVNQLGGEIKVSSQSGAGATFDIFLPVSARVPDVAQIQSSPTPADVLTGKTVLVTEDEPELRDILADMLGSMQMTVLTAMNGNDAMDVQKKYDGKIDLLLTDVMMPEMDGAELGAAFSSARPDSNVVYMSAYPYRDIRRKIEFSDDGAFIAKPLHEDKIREVLSRALQHRDKRLEQDGNAE